MELLNAELGRTPSPTGFVAIEDSRWGIEAAAAAGLPCVGVTTTYRAGELPGAAAIVSCLADVDCRSLTALYRRLALAPVDVRTPPVQNGNT